jgi:hypothetical protein
VRGEDKVSPFVYDIYDIWVAYVVCAALQEPNQSLRNSNLQKNRYVAPHRNTPSNPFSLRLSHRFRQHSLPRRDTFSFGSCEKIHVVRFAPIV